MEWRSCELVRSPHCRSSRHHWDKRARPEVSPRYRYAHGNRSGLIQRGPQPMVQTQYSHADNTDESKTSCLIIDFIRLDTDCTASLLPLLTEYILVRAQPTPPRTLS